MFVPAPGHHRWLATGYRDWRQSFDDVRARAQEGAVEQAYARLAAEKAEERAAE